MAEKYLIDGAAYCGDGLAQNEAVGSTVTITIASPGVVTWNAHGLANNDAIYLTTTGALPTGLVAGTKYFVRNAAANTFELSATSGGASINTTGTQSPTHTARGTGAWNNINVFEGTLPQVGTIAAGDVVHIRSKKSGDAAMTYTHTSNKTFGANGSIATAANPITWIFDNGVKWSGVDGDVIYETSSSTISHSFKVNNTVKHGRRGGLILRITANPNNDFGALANVSGRVINALFDLSAKTSINVYNVRGSGVPVFEACNFKFGLLSTYYQYGGFVGADSGNHKITLIDPDIELTNAGSNTAPVFAAGEGVNWSTAYEVYGGRVHGAGAGSSINLVFLSGAAARFRSVGFKIPIAMRICHATQAMPVVTGQVEIIACDVALGGHFEDARGRFTSRPDNNPPYLSAALPDGSSTPWAWRVLPKAPTHDHPQVIGPSLKVFTGAAAQQVITQEILVGTTLEVDKSSMWAVVQYTDNATGLPVSVSTQDFVGGALEESFANWLPSITWELTTFVKRKMVVTTPTDVKSGTAVMVSTYCRKVAPTDAAIYMVDPDFAMVPA